MNREIKFRAWDKEGNQWIEKFYIDWDGAIGTVGYSYLGEPGTHIQDKVVLMQFTGLKDKNGKEIYEGDILATDYNKNGTKIGVTKGVVTWDKKNMCYYSKEKADNGQMVNTYMKHMFEVIGNIYENPELVSG